MDHKNFAFNKTNFILLGIGMIIVVFGFILMAGGASSEQAFNAEMFNATRIKVAPMICLFGFLFMIAAIVWHRKEDDKDAEQEETTEKK